MWNEISLKVIPMGLFLFCILEILELVLIIEITNKTEKIEVQLQKNLEILETIIKTTNNAATSSRSRV